MTRYFRSFLKASPLGPFCQKARISPADFHIGGDSFDVCWGLDDPGLDGWAWPECAGCRAFHLNIPSGAGELEASVAASRALARSGEAARDGR